MSEKSNPLHAKISLYDEFADSTAPMPDEAVTVLIRSYGVPITSHDTTIDKPFKLFGWELPFGVRQHIRQRTAEREKTALFYTHGDTPLAGLTLNVPIEALVALHIRAVAYGRILDLTNEKLPLIRQAAARSGLLQTPPPSWPLEQREALAQEASAQFFASLPAGILLER